MGLFKKKNKANAEVPNELPSMPDLPTIDEPPMAAPSPSTNSFDASLPELPDLEVPQAPNMQNNSQMPEAPNSNEGMDIPDFKT